jgi:hypothetical protein
LKVIEQDKSESSRQNWSDFDVEAKTGQIQSLPHMDRKSIQKQEESGKFVT